MQPLQQQQQSRINLTELKVQIVKKIGPERSKRYFYYLNRLLSHKLSKAEFDKLCLRTLGKESLPLHNQLIHSILRNACHAKVPPPIHKKEFSPKDGYQQSGPSSTSTSGPTPLVWSNGDVLSTSPRKIRSGIRDRRPVDRPSPLGPNGKTDFTSHLSTGANEGSATKVITENGDLSLYDFERPVQHHQVVLEEQPENDRDALLQRPTKRPRTKKSPEDPVSVHSKCPLEVVIVEDGQEAAKRGKKPIFTSRSPPLSAPLGIPFCSASVGGSRRALPTINTYNFTLASDRGELSDTETLRIHMEQIVGAQCLEGVSTECANLLNNGLDAYLKRLIRSCIELVGSRSGHEPTNPSVHKQHPRGKLINNILPGHQFQMQCSSGPVEGMQEQRTRCPVSLPDFKVAMELNPQQLGEDWPSLLEKICIHSYEE